ncbi:MAG TPA: M1 family metallopeptidase, partial [Ferruginibacter sp.]|nr:M1 family metallopeptidase [Ferruginibacter sp.]
PARRWWNITHYAITVEPDYNSRSIRGAVDIRFTVTSNKHEPVMQVDLQAPMILDSVIYQDQSLQWQQDGQAYFLKVGHLAMRDSVLHCYFHGTPRAAVRPPWDGGWIWSKDKAGNPWMSVACQGLGASVWYPCKDYQGDEPERGASLLVFCADSLQAIANGRLVESGIADGKNYFKWEVKNPINNYNLVPYIGKYTHWHESYAGIKGPLDMDYWVLPANESRARTQFKDAGRMMQAFEWWFGPYPFYEDGYKLVEAPHLGMEHHSAIAYGNGYTNGYRGTDLSGSGWGNKWDFIIVHESGHEWFANNITTNDIADMWVHEGFTNYSETLFTEFFYGKAAATDYIVGIRKLIQNDVPIIGTYGINKEGSGDMYYKGGNLVHLIRQLMQNDSSFRLLLHDLNQHFYHQTINGSEVEKRMAQ